jgi:hypothetical protein
MGASCLPRAWACEQTACHVRSCEGFRMPAHDGRCRALGGPASENLHRRKPRVGSVRRVPRARCGRYGGFDRDGSIDGKRAARSMATVDEVGGHERSAFEGHGWIAGRRLAGKKWHRWHVRASVMVAGREPAKKTSGFAASWPRRGGHEVSILIAAGVPSDGSAASRRARRSR